LTNNVADGKRINAQDSFSQSMPMTTFRYNIQFQFLFQFEVSVSTWANCDHCYALL